MLSAFSHVIAEDNRTQESNSIRRNEMAHKLAQKWRSYTLTVTDGKDPVMDPDDLDNSMDLTKMNAQGVLSDGLHGNTKITGQAQQIAGPLYFLTLDHAEGPIRHYEGYLVHDFVRDNKMVIAGKVLFGHNFEARAPSEFVQDEATWVLTKP
jgi:hypothetical protein